MHHPKLTWEELVRRQPLLGELEAMVVEVRDDPAHPSFCANNVWTQHFEDRMFRLVGLHAERHDPVLRTREAYDLAFQHLHELLPDCRNCLCA